MKFFGPLCLVLSVFALADCASSLAIPPELTPPELIQKAQAESDKNRYSRALQYYEAILERYPSYIDEICAAEYEIAHIHYKRKKYSLAETGYTNLLDRYNTPDAELLPPQFRRLAEIGLQKIAEKQRKKKTP
ncbi:MAG: hypothetical protein LBG87_06660 [Spirochaetaceae bacterium]|jgi:outer membrane protein assembly factor BamD (BamD/ComL family)|nr:hypothetical protein [Spirochaetaceae bacterium]